MLKTIQKALSLLEYRDRKKIKLLFFLLLLIGIIETIGTLLIMPFIYLVTKPQTIYKNDYLHHIYLYWGYTHVSTFILTSGIFVLVFVFFGFFLRAYIHWNNARFVHKLNFNISSRLLETYLKQPYHWFLQQNSADLNKMVLTEVLQFTTYVMMPLMMMVSNLGIAVCIGILLAVISPILALCSLLIFGGSYLIIFSLQSKRMDKMGMQRFEAQGACYKIAQEALDGIKEIKVAGLEQRQIIDFDGPAKILSTNLAGMQILNELPQFIFQAIAFAGMISVILVFVVLKDNKLESLMPLLALYAFATLRLIPAFQKVYGAFTQMKFGDAALNKLYKDIQLATPSIAENIKKPVSLNFNCHLCWDKLSYTYPGSASTTLKNISFTIQKNQIIGFTGKSGTGKTTAVDLITGLLEPISGNILIDNQVLNVSNKRLWQDFIGYVPQHIYLADNSIAANIAFGIPSKEIDLKAVAKAARIAEIACFIENELPDSYQTMIGEKGFRFSGGQRQRIGIARALYKNPILLVLDEATNAIDAGTEERIFNNIASLRPAKTMIVITHHFQNLKICDRIFYFENSMVKEYNNLKEIIAHKIQ